MNKNQKLSSKIVFVIVFSALVLLVALCAALSVLIKWRKTRKPSNAIGPVFTPSINKKTGNISRIFLSYLSSWKLMFRIVFALPGLIVVYNLHVYSYSFTMRASCHLLVN